MDAGRLLESAADAYRNLKTVEAGATVITESRDTGFNRSEQPVKFFYAAPNQARLEHRGSIFACDGRDQYVYFSGPKQYSKGPIGPQPVTGLFNPEHPHLQNYGCFLFQRIAERVSHAEILRSEAISMDGQEIRCEVASVTYEPRPQRGFVINGSPLLFWVETGTHLVLRMEFEVTMQFPRQDEPIASRQTLATTRLAVNRPIEASTFVLARPADAEEMPGGTAGFIDGGRGGRGGRTVSGFSRYADGRDMQWHRSDHWDGETFVEECRYEFRGQEITIERRWAYSEDGQEIRITEQTRGLKEQIENTYSIPVA